MKKKVISGIVLTAMLLSITSCNKEEVVETTTKPINVDRDDLMYAENEILPEVTTSMTEAVEITTTIETSTTPATSPMTDKEGEKINNPQYPSLPYEYKDSVYNTTIDKYLTDVDFGKVVVYKWEEINGADRKGVGFPIYVGTADYYYQGIAYSFLNGAEISCYDDEKEDYPYEIKITEDDKNPYSFSFFGAGHYIGLDRIVNEIEKPNFYLELETLNSNGDRIIINLDYIPNLKSNLTDCAGIKAIATKLSDFIGFDENGVSLFDEDISLYYVAEIDGNEFSFYTGMPFSYLKEKLGEPIEITGKNKMLVDEEKNITLNDIEESTYYVYKTVDYTLVLETGDIREIAKEVIDNNVYITVGEGDDKYEISIDDYPEEQAEIITSIILIRNRVEYNQNFINRTVTTTPAETAPEEETTEISTTVSE